MWGSRAFGESNQESGYGGQGGGGFTHDTSFGGGGFSSQPQEGKRTGSRSQSMMPVTIRQILKAEQIDDGFSINEKEVHQVTMIGRITSVEESSTNIMYKICDMTDEALNVRKWIDVEDSSIDSDKRSECREGVMVRVTGHLRAFQGQKSLVAFGIAPVTDFNEVTYHMMDVVHTHLALEKGIGKSGGGVGGSTSTGVSSSTGGGVQSMEVSEIGLKPVENEIYQAILHCKEEAGIGIQNLSAKAQSKAISNHQVRQIVEFLSNEGHIYSTIDDDHYKATEG